MVFVPAPLESRIDSNVQRGEPGDCWPWTGGQTDTTPGKVVYGKLKVGGVSRPAHRVVLELKLGRPLRPGMWALHTCDFGLCCNPGHLYEGTPKDNSFDRDSRCRRVPVKGERHHWAKLSDAQRVEIINRRASGEPLKSIAVDYGITDSRVSQIARAA